MVKESRFIVAYSTGDPGGWRLTTNGHSFFWGDENALKLDHDYDCTIPLIY